MTGRRLDVVGTKQDNGTFKELPVPDRYIDTYRLGAERFVNGNRTESYRLDRSAPLWPRRTNCYRRWQNYSWSYVTRLASSNWFMIGGRSPTVVITRRRPKSNVQIRRDMYDRTWSSALIWWSDLCTDWMSITSINWSAIVGLCLNIFRKSKSDRCQSGWSSPLDIRSVTTGLEAKTMQSEANINHKSIIDRLPCSRLQFDNRVNFRSFVETMIPLLINHVDYLNIN